MKRNWRVFISSVFFVLGFALVFSVVGVLLQSVFSGSGFTINIWLSRIAGTVIIIFGIFLTGLVRPKFLQKEYKFKMRRFKSQYLTAFVFGAAFAVGWTPCIGPILGAILTLAVTQPVSAFIPLFAYSLGLGIPFLAIGLFTNESERFIRKAGPWLKYVNIAFGVILIALGILVFTSQLARVANFAFASSFLISLDVGLGAVGTLNVLFAFLAGIVSFLSPCILPIVPGFLAFLGTSVTKKDDIKKQG